MPVSDSFHSKHSGAESTRTTRFMTGVTCKRTSSLLTLEGTLHHPSRHSCLGAAPHGLSASCSFGPSCVTHVGAVSSCARISGIFYCRSESRDFGSATKDRSVLFL